MTYINWDEPFYFNTRTLSTSASPDGPYSVPIPTYGNYGGPGYTQGDFGENPLEQPTSSERPLDALDRRFYLHDVATALAEGDPDAQVAADLTLIRRIDGLTSAQLADPEARVYAGLATLVFIGEVAADGTREQFLAARQALPDAVENIASGLADLPAGELRIASRWLAEVVDTIESDGRTNFLDRAVDVLDDYLPFL
jgi:hypothetical protein